MIKLPETFVNRIKQQLGEEETANYLECYDKPRYQGLRVNTTKISVEEFMKISPFPLERVPWTENGFYIDGSLKPAKHPYYASGLYYLQEPSAMTPAAMLPIEPGDRVLDMCAAPGGKTTELGSKLRGSGILYANDISQSRARALLRNIELFGIKNSVVISEAPEKLLGHMRGYFDKILIDAPCSGEGMFRKENSIISNWEQTGTSYYAKIQRQIILTGAKLLKPGGMMLYSTCTFSPEEDEDAVLYLLKNCPYMKLCELPMVEGFDTGHPEWVGIEDEEFKDFDADKYGIDINELKKCRRLWPHRLKGEGHFLALLKKDEHFDNPDYEEDYQMTYGSYPYKRYKLNEDALAFFNEFGFELDENRIEEHEGNLYYSPTDMADVRGLRILRSGIYLGECKKKRFEPSEALALSLTNMKDECIISFDSKDERVSRYLRGETLNVTDDDGQLSNGLKLITVDGYPLGWGKLINGMIKNKLPATWRA